MTLKEISFQHYRSFGAETATISLEREFLGIVGTNNSGKSTLLRAFYELRPIFARLAMSQGNDELLRALSSPHGLAPGANPLLQAGERINPENAAPGTRPRITIRFRRDESATPDLIKELGIELGESAAIHIDLVLADGTVVQPSSVAAATHVRAGDGIRVGLQWQDGTTRFVHWDEIVPDLQMLTDTIYIGAFRNSINAAGSTYYDLSIGRDFIAQFNIFDTGPDAKANQSIKAMTSEIANIFGIRDLDVSASSDGSHFRFLVDGVSYRGSELGAGISQFVIVAATVLVRRPAILLIDEPELNLHASLQLRFLTLLAQYVRGPVVFATHSLGLARSAADQVLVASRNALGDSTLRDYQMSTNLSITLGELGYSGLHDATYKAVLLVEGVTDVRAMRELLVKYNVRGEVVIVQLGGDGMAVGHRDHELAELRKLSEHIYSIVDSEKRDAAGQASPRRRAFAKSCLDQGIDCLVLDRRAIENYLNHEASDPVMGLKGLAGLGEYDDAPSGWSKSKNWRAIREIPKTHFDGTDLGAFMRKIAGAILKSSKLEKRRLAAESSAICEKRTPTPPRRVSPHRTPKEITRPP